MYSSIHTVRHCSMYNSIPRLYNTLLYIHSLLSSFALENRSSNKVRHWTRRIKVVYLHLHDSEKFLFGFSTEQTQLCELLQPRWRHQLGFILPVLYRWEAGRQMASVMWAVTKAGKILAHIGSWNCEPTHHHKRVCCSTDTIDSLHVTMDILHVTI